MEKQQLNETCPVCDKEMYTERDLLENVICEERKNCPNGCYTENFAYGITEVIIGDQIFFTSYSDSYKELMVAQDGIAKLIQEKRMQIGLKSSEDERN